MKRPLFSILIPTHNRSALLKETLVSLERQAAIPEEIEIILSDDCSADDTQSVIAACRERLPGIKAFRHDANLGVARNHEFLLQQAAGEFVHLLCDDDALSPDFLRTHRDILSGEPEVDLIFGDLELRAPDFGFLTNLALDTPPGALAGAARCRQQLLSHHMVQPVVYRRSLLLSAGGWDARVGCHLDCTAFCRSALRARKTYRIARPMLYFRISPGSFSHDLATRDQGQLARWYRRKLDLLREDASSLWPGGVEFIDGMYAWHARGILIYLEIELAHRHISGAQARSSMEALMTVFPEARGTLMAAKLRLASRLGTGWLRLLRRLLGKPDPYQTTLALFNSFPASPPSSLVRKTENAPGP